MQEHHESWQPTGWVLTPTYHCPWVILANISQRATSVKRALLNSLISCCANNGCQSIWRPGRQNLPETRPIVSPLFSVLLNCNGCGLQGTRRCGMSNEHLQYLDSLIYHVVVIQLLYTCLLDNWLCLLLLRWVILHPTLPAAFLATHWQTQKQWLTLLIGVNCITALVHIIFASSTPLFINFLAQDEEFSLLWVLLLDGLVCLLSVTLFNIRHMAKGGTCNPDLFVLSPRRVDVDFGGSVALRYRTARRAVAGERDTDSDASGVSAIGPDVSEDEYGMV
eukprot:TRINITY_DN9810_c0_g1_i1.p1 TRINITY_DN9810_c0_g1~~TRINITY_DN9810_c0_g1_i1.p1  ORF type:complete len:279 (-),score=34.49 TRINITY_DN9810_c0_g1_i1:145-981(-)